MSKYSQPAYTVEKISAAESPIEIRQYPPLLLAGMTAPDAERREAASAAFMPLFRYIEAANIPMTVPVTQIKDPKAPGWRLQFIMPADKDKKALPAPDKAGMKLVEMPATRYAVIKFSGRASDTAIAENEQKLRSFIKAEGLRISGAPVYAYYDDPFTLPMFRRNEVLIPLDAGV
ncbi:MAG: heme-binding protein [Thalassospira sp.]|nr:heme-binding protein [Thalassospira sp.]